MLDNEPSEVRFNTDRSRRTRRYEAVMHARQIVAQSDDTETVAIDAPHVVDEAFADLPAPATGQDASLSGSVQPTDKVTKLGAGLMEQLASQLEQLDAQREHLKSLLDSVKQ